MEFRVELLKLVELELWSTGRVAICRMLDIWMWGVKTWLKTTLTIGIRVSFILEAQTELSKLRVIAYYMKRGQTSIMME